jgi:short subunit dehydrogenase-like uncharacterized protein
MLAILGATGYTGRLVVDEARRAGISLRLVGRHREALEELALPGEEVRLADGHDREALRRALSGAFAVVSAAGPFLEIGYGPVAAAIDVGAHYLDISGEQQFIRRVYENFNSPAADAGIVLLPAFGMDYVPGDFAARLAADGLEQPLDELMVGYFLDATPSAGTMKTAALIGGRPHVTRVADRLVESGMGMTSRTFTFPFGDRKCLEWGGAEPLTVPRHTRVRTVRSYWRLPEGGIPEQAPAGSAAGEAPAGPSPDERAASSVAVTAVARRGSYSRTVMLAGSDPYGLTALLIVQGYLALVAGEASGTGALAPAEAFDVETFLPRLAPLLVRAEAEA